MYITKLFPNVKYSKDVASFKDPHKRSINNEYIHYKKNRPYKLKSAQI